MEGSDHLERNSLLNPEFLLSSPINPDFYDDRWLNEWVCSVARTTLAQNQELV